MMVPVVLIAVACAKSKSPDAAAAPTSTAAARSSPSPATPLTICPATGEWATCSVMYRLVRAGLAPKIDSSATPEEKALHGSGMVIDIGRTAKLEVFLYADSAARKVDAAHLDRSQLVSATAPQTIRRERTLIENANLVGLLTSINDHQRERVSDALTAGPPQPATP
jgi:hypothetical protein